MRNIFIFRIMAAAMLILIACSSISCAAWGEFSPERIDKMHEEDKKWSNWFEKYIKSVLYVGMPEDEFVRLFTKDKSWVDSQRPYIIKHKGSEYIVLALNGVKHRVSFTDGKLDQFETLGYEKIPIIGSTSWDYTSSLRGYKAKNAPGFYDGMSEDEFLATFSGSILSHSENRYVVTGKNGRKYRVTFKDGYLIGMETIRQF